MELLLGEISQPVIGKDGVAPRILKLSVSRNTRSQRSEVSGPSARSSSGRRQNSPVKVLLIDDDEDSYLLTRRLLSAGNGIAEVDWASNFEEGLKGIRAGKHDVFLVDFRLGPRDGLELLREAIALGCRAPIILLTTENPDVDAEAMRLGAADFLNKDQLEAALLERSIRYSMKQYETLRALRESEARFACFMQNVPCAVYMKDAEGRYLYVNETCEKAFRRGSQDWIGKTDDELWPEPLARRFKEQDAEVLRSQRALDGTEIVIQPDGTHFWLSSKFPILDEQGVPVMIGGTGIDITARKRLEQEFQEITEEEKRRVGQDLHDGLGQYLAGISFMAKLLQTKLAAKHLPEAVDAGQITDLVNQTVAQTRDLARGLCPLELETNGLHAALEELAASAEKLFNVSCRLQCETMSVIADKSTASHLYRIAQEAINNAVKHGKAKTILIGLSSSDRTTSMTVEDNGIGLAADISTRGGLGFRVMNYRAGMIGASIKIENGRKGGTIVTCLLANARNAEPPKAP